MDCYGQPYGDIPLTFLPTFDSRTLALIASPYVHTYLTHRIALQILTWNFASLHARRPSPVARRTRS